MNNFFFFLLQHISYMDSDRFRGILKLLTMGVLLILVIVTAFVDGVSENLMALSVSVALILYPVYLLLLLIVKQLGHALYHHHADPEDHTHRRLSKESFAHATGLLAFTLALVFVICLLIFTYL